MPQKTTEFRMVYADAKGNIFDHPHLRMVCRRGREWAIPNPNDVLPLPPESEFFLLPSRRAVGVNPDTGELEAMEDGLAVAAFLAPAHTISAHPAYVTDKDAPLLPLFAYCALGFVDDHFVVCAQRVDTDTRQEFANIPRKTIAREAQLLRKRYRNNRLVQHILNNCVARYDCPAARNFALGRFEAPLPTSRTCPARCLGCISLQEKGSPIQTTPQCRLSFTPSPEEIAGVMEIHAGRERKSPIFSFGQGCEGDPLEQAELLCESIRLFRKKGGHGTINCNTNASRTAAIPNLAAAGLTSIRVSLNSAQPDLYTRYYRPQGYDFQDVWASMVLARQNDLFISLNLLFFPGITDTEEELGSLADLITRCGVSMVQWRNLNIDPEWYLEHMLKDKEPQTYGMGLKTFKDRLTALCPWLRSGYFNPWLGDRASLTAPKVAS